MGCLWTNSVCCTKATQTRAARKRRTPAQTALTLTVFWAKGPCDQHSLIQLTQGTVSQGLRTCLDTSFRMWCHPGKLTLDPFTRSTHLYIYKAAESSSFVSQKPGDTWWTVNIESVRNKIWTPLSASHHPVQANKGFMVFSFSASSLLFVISQPIGDFGYSPLSLYLQPALQLFRVPIGHCHYLDFNLAPRSPCPDSPTGGSWLPSACSLQVKLAQQKQSDSVLSLRSGWKGTGGPSPATKGPLWACLSIGCWKPRKLLCLTRIKSREWSRAQIFFH